MLGICWGRGDAEIEAERYAWRGAGAREHARSGSRGTRDGVAGREEREKRNMRRGQADERVRWMRRRVARDVRNNQLFVKLSPNILTLTEGPSGGQKVGDSLVARCVRVVEVLRKGSRMQCGRIRNSMLRTRGDAISKTTPLLRLKLLHFFAIPSNDSQ